MKRIKLKTVSGSLRAVENQRIWRRYRQGPVTNPFPDLSVFAQDEAEYLDEIVKGIRKARIEGDIYCVKSVVRDRHGSFLKGL